MSNYDGVKQVLHKIEERKKIKMKRDLAMTAINRELDRIEVLKALLAKEEYRKAKIKWWEFWK